MGYSGVRAARGVLLVALGLGLMLSLIIQPHTMGNYTALAQQTGKVAFVTRSLEKPNGAIVKLNLALGSVQSTVTRLDYPGGIACGDGKLYVEDRTGITRFNQDGSEKIVILRDTSLGITELTLAPNGDLFFGTWDRGVWRIRGADPNSAPEQVLPESWNTSYFVSGLAFHVAAPYQGDLLIAVAPNRGSGGYLLRASQPSFDELDLFLEEGGGYGVPSPALVTDVAVNSLGDVFVTDWTGGKVFRYSSDGTFLETFAEFANANQIAFDSEDIAYVTNAVYWATRVTGGVIVIYPDGGKNVFGGIAAKGVATCD